VSQEIHGLFFLIPAQINFPITGPDETKNRARRGVLRLVQIRLGNTEFGKNLAHSSRKFAATLNRRFQFQKSSQFSIRVHNETLFVSAMCVCNPRLFAR
jgi:hypothetical protein